MESGDILALFGLFLGETVYIVVTTILYRNHQNHTRINTGINQGTAYGLG